MLDPELLRQEIWEADLGVRAESGLGGEPRSSVLSRHWDGEQLGIPCGKEARALLGPRIPESKLGWAGRDLQAHPIPPLPSSQVIPT